MASNDESTDEPTTSTATDGTGLSPELAGTLSYLLGFVTGVIFYILEPKSSFVRFHATQSIIVFGGLFVLSVAIWTLTAIFTAIPFFGWFFAFAFGGLNALVGLVGLLLWLWLMYQAFIGNEYEVPIAGRYAREHMTVE